MKILTLSLSVSLAVLKQTEMAIAMKEQFPKESLSLLDRSWIKWWQN